MPKKVHIISLGCAKNLVDSEVLSGLLKEKNCEFVEKPIFADIVILNTCSFIGEARKEAKHYINNLIKYKKIKAFKLLIIGCLPQVEKENLLKKYPEIDGIFGVSDICKISEFIENPSKKIISVSSLPVFMYKSSMPRIVTTPKSYAYIKIADGCDNRCSYCLIPAIRGPYREREVEDVVKEAQKLVSGGTKEIILVSNDTTRYGTKIYKKKMLHVLVSKLSKIKELLWIRILYTHPGHFYDELIYEIANNEKVCKYIDMPIQHTSDKILSLMGRNTTRADILKLVERLKKKVKNIALRTTVIVGFPQETDRDFEVLLEDIKQLEFDWLGTFMFSLQKNTKAQDLYPKIPYRIKKERYTTIMSTQQKITYKKNLSRVNKIYKVLCDSDTFGHTEFQCPEIDGRVYFSGKSDDLVENIKIEKADIYDVYGKLI
ncbi:MAG: 30S ribosomal protein S12 methylthiotransferase RimO [Endomicrobiia bacterium]